MKRQTRFYHVFAWNHAGKLIEYVLTYCFSVLVACKLGVEQNGAYATFLALAPEAKIKTRVSAYPLAEANRALDDLRSGRLQGAAVLIPPKI